MAWRGAAWQGWAGRGWAGRGMARRGEAGRGRARLGKAGHGVARHGKAGPGMAWPGEARRGLARRGEARILEQEGQDEMNKVIAIREPTNGGKSAIEFSQPYSVVLQLTGAADLLFHRWNCESVTAKSKAAKNSAAKKTDDIESYVWRDDAGMLCIPGEYVRQVIIDGARFKPDPRSPRKSAMDLFKAGIVSLTQLASLGAKEWDYLDTRRVTVQRNGINRTRPAMKTGWCAQFDLQVLTPEYINPDLLYDVLAMSGRLVGIGDFRPTYGRFNVTRFELAE